MSLCISAMVKDENENYVFAPKDIFTSFNTPSEICCTQYLRGILFKSGVEIEDGTKLTQPQVELVIGHTKKLINDFIVYDDEDKIELFQLTQLNKFCAACLQHPEITVVLS